MAEKHAHNGILEQGDLFFFYHPKVGRDEVRGVEDVASFHLVLHPADRGQYRYLALELLALLRGRHAGGWWGKVEAVTAYPDIARRIRHPLLPPARPCGEGVYAIVRHGRHTHLTYELELPEVPGVVQATLGISKQGNPLLAVKNPLFEALASLETPQVEVPEYPHRLQRLFRDRWLRAAQPVELLDYAGVEILLADIEPVQAKELGVDLHPEHEDMESAEIFKLLRQRRQENPVKPLLEGAWT